MESKHKNALIGALLAVVFVMAVGYAAFAQQLTINGSASISSSWDVHIESIAVDETSKVGEAASTKAEVGTDNTTATFATTLKSPTDSLTYNVTVKNGGNLDAKLSTLTFSDNSTTDPIVYTYTDIAENDTLDAGQSTTFKVTVTYNASVETQPTQAQLNKDVTMVLNYVQA